jgi:hypothetical protein
MFYNQSAKYHIRDNHTGPKRTSIQPPPHKVVLCEPCMIADAASPTTEAPPARFNLGCNYTSPDKVYNGKVKSITTNHFAKQRKKTFKQPIQYYQIVLSIPHWTLYNLQSLHKCLGDLVCAHPIKITGLWLWKLPIPHMMPQTPLPEMSLAVMGAIIIFCDLRYSIAAISLLAGRPWSTVHNLVDRATDCQSFEHNARGGRWWILTQR